MPPRPPQRERLQRLMNDRAGELGLTWAQVAEAGGVSYEAIRAARDEDKGIRGTTRGAIERGLRWEAGSVSRILDGNGDPVSLPPGPAEPAEAESPGGRSLAAVPDSADEDAVIELLIANERDPDRQAVLRQTWEFTAVKRADRLV